MNLKRLSAICRTGSPLIERTAVPLFKTVSLLFKLMATTAESSPIQTESPLSVLFADFEGELATTRRMLERVPNGHDDYRPHEKSRSLGQLATHLAQLPGFGIMMLTQDEFDGKTQRPEEPDFASSADRVKFFDDLSAKLRGVLRKLTWDQARSTWTLRIGDNVLLEEVRLFDVYAGAQVGEGRKSLAYKLTFRAPDRTLTADEALAARDAAVASANRLVGATLRGA